MGFPGYPGGIRERSLLVSNPRERRGEMAADGYAVSQGQLTACKDRRILANNQPKGFTLLVAVLLIMNPEVYSHPGSYAIVFAAKQMCSAYSYKYLRPPG